MTTSHVVSILLIVLPIAFNLAFAALAKTFDHPDILRRPTREILARFRAGGSGLVLLLSLAADSLGLAQSSVVPPPTRTSILPVFAPRIMSRNASTVLSMPSTMVSS